MHLARETDSPHVGRLQLRFLHDSSHSFHGRLPPVLRVLLTPQRFGMVAGVRRQRVCEDLAALVDGERFRAGSADVDAEVDAHWWLCESVGRERLLYALACES